MAITPRLDLRQSQNLVMTPQLQQAIKLLQLSNMELAQFVDQELEKNPILEREDPDQAQRGDRPEERSPEPAASQGGESTAPEESQSLDSKDYAEQDTLPETNEGPLDADYENMWSSNEAPAAEGTQARDTEGPAGGEEAHPDSMASWGSGGRSDFSTPDSNIEQTVSSETSLRDHLLSQLNMDVVDPADRVIGLHLIDQLDEAGYFIGDVAAIAALLGCEIARVEATLEQLRRFDPTGIFARDLADCLALQLEEIDRLDPAMEAMINNLDLLAKRDLQGLIKICGVDAEDITDMISEIRALNPKPAMSFQHDVSQAITPDVLMRPGPKGGWAIELNQETLPKVLVNTTYYAEVSQSTRSKKDKDYIVDCFNSANWLVKSLHQRATTILKVATEIVRQQDAFFQHGVQHLKPMVLRDIAEVIDMHESTVSRVTANKFIATSRGNYELKYFFTSSIPASAGGQAHSAEAVRDHIRQMIDNEPATKVLSDDKIVEILGKEGIDIARRTVAKYRESMRIPSSIQRRRDKKSEI